MKTRFALFALVALWNSAYGEPELLKAKSFSPAMLAEAVNHYVALGEVGAYKELSALSQSVSLPTSPDARETRDRISWVLRILYEPVANPLRRPGYEGLAVPSSMYTTWPVGAAPWVNADWPLFPVTLWGSTYFVLSNTPAFSNVGEAESATHYLEYCRANGKFRSKPVPVPTREVAVRDAKALLDSAAWKAIRWDEESRVFEYEAGIRAFIRLQIDAIE
jgi:hypothetical protein